MFCYRAAGKQAQGHAGRARRCSRWLRSRGGQAEGLGAVVAHALQRSKGTSTRAKVARKVCDARSPASHADARAAGSLACTCAQHMCATPTAAGAEPARAQARPQQAMCARTRRPLLAAAHLAMPTLQAALQVPTAQTPSAHCCVTTQTQSAHGCVTTAQTPSSDCCVTTQTLRAHGCVTTAQTQGDAVAGPSIFPFAPDPHAPCLSQTRRG